LFGPTTSAAAAHRFIAAVFIIHLSTETKMTLQIDKNELRPLGTPAANAADAPAAADIPAVAENAGAAPIQTQASSRTAGKTNATGAHVDYARLAAKLSAGGRGPASLNMLGVCQMRLGNAAEAVRIYRALVLQPGCTWERTDIPALYKRNFATALLLTGLPAGCVSVLHALCQPDHPRCRQLFAAIRNWERSLTFLQRWDWRLNGVAPKHCQIVIDFEPGEFDENVPQPADGL
jgi:hypothetical protein